MIRNIATDSRPISDGALFAALPGARVHGARFAADALERGAVAVLTDQAGAAMAGEVVASADRALVVVGDPRLVLARISARWFGAQPKVAAAVTGTNGKTSAVTFLRQIWAGLGRQAASVGTMGMEGAWTAPLTHTTPDPIVLHRALAQATDAGVTHVAVEASSHGLDQRRLDGMRLVAAGYTNLSRDHLDYHDGFADYFAAKAGLFLRILPPGGTAVINLEDPRGDEMRAIARERRQNVIAVGRGRGDLDLLSQDTRSTGQELLFAWKGARHRIGVNLIGEFQAHNVAMAACLAIACGEEPDAVFGVLPHLATVRGRMQTVARRANGASVFVDYAHTPDAVEKALAALRPHVPGQIVVLLGAGGDRDASKRPLMGAAAARGADRVIVTDDNPRSEDPAGIRAAVLAGAREAGAESVLEIGDRAEAILRGADVLEGGDALLIAGKGHETGQVIGDSVLPFDDAEQASIVVRLLDGGRT